MRNWGGVWALQHEGHNRHGDDAEDDADESAASSVGLRVGSRREVGHFRWMQTTQLKLWPTPPYMFDPKILFSIKLDPDQIQSRSARYGYD